MRVADLLKKKNTAPLITVKATDSLKEAIKKLDYERIGDVVKHLMAETEKEPYILESVVVA